ncbi:hypothetical protein C1645_837726 [Glomus cerebriforme]|uniref:SbsA Ig-like domain-containing protein n=1 Tax=Glomus cerebriforme TaxID=658196 RepID=A0A397S3K5_9GLOM|nr:hypothetical protein C1645_837726 [Glomus cerebriforme]
MNLKVIKRFQKLLLITLLLFNLIQSSTSFITFNKVSYHTKNGNNGTSNLLMFEDNTLVIINGPKTVDSVSVSRITVQVLRNDGNHTSFELKCPLPKCNFKFQKASPLKGYLFIPYRTNIWYGMVLKLDGSSVNERIKFDPDILNIERIMINDDHMLWVEAMEGYLYSYTYFNIPNIEEGTIITRWNGVYFLPKDAIYDIVFTPVGEYSQYTIVYYYNGALYYSYVKPKRNFHNESNELLLIYDYVGLTVDGINCNLDRIDSTIGNCLFNLRNSLLWSTFNYTENGVDFSYRFIQLNMTIGYQVFIMTPLTYRSGFLILGYENNLEIQRFTAFILNKTNLMQQAYLPSFIDEQERQDWIYNNTDFPKINTYYQEFFIPTDVFPVDFKNFKDYEYHFKSIYYFNLLPNNSLILSVLGNNSKYDLWSADLTSSLIEEDNITQGMMLNFKSDLPPNVGLIPSNNSPIQIHSKSINITFGRPIYLQKNNITIYQINNSKKFLRQIFKFDSKFINIDQDKNIVTLTIIESVFNVPGATYSLEIDEQLFRYRTGIDGSVLSNRSSIYYNTATEEYKFAVKATVLLRLTEDGTNLFEKSDDKSLFLKNLTEGLAENIPLNDYSQIKINNYEIDKSINKRQLLLSLLINPPVDKVNNINVEQIKESLDIMIKNLEVTPLSLNNYTKYLDSSYGCALKDDLWDRYKYILIGIVCASIILIALFLLARKKCKEGNNLIIFKLALLISDMVSDFLFVIGNSSNVENLRIPSIVFLVIPMVTNLIFVFHIFITECMDNKKYIVWLKENSQPAAIITILCGGDIAVLKLLSSNLAGFELFNAPLSKKAEKIIYYGVVLNTFMEDVPQLIIQIIYHYKTISYDIIPLISLTTGSIILLSTIVGHTYNIVIRIYTKMKVGDQNNELIKNSLEECDECGEHAISCVQSMLDPQHPKIEMNTDVSKE